MFWGGIGGLNPFSGGTWTLRVNDRLVKVLMFQFMREAYANTDGLGEVERSVFNAVLGKYIGCCKFGVVDL